MARRNTNLAGASGEYFVMFRLLRLGLIAALAPDNAPDIDILVSDRSGTVLSAVQVKMAMDQVTVGWRMNVKHETIVRDRLFYCFVDPGPSLNDMPQCWIIPSAIVAEHVTSTHRAWLREGAEKQLRRNDGDTRKLHKVVKHPPLDRYPTGWIDQFHEAWHLLSLTA